MVARNYVPRLHYFCRHRITSRLSFFASFCYAIKTSHLSDEKVRENELIAQKTVSEWFELKFKRKKLFLLHSGVLGCLIQSKALSNANGLFVYLFRIGLLNRIALLYVINFLSHTFYIIYLNTKDSIFCYLFSITSILLVSATTLILIISKLKQEIHK